MAFHIVVVGVGAPPPLEVDDILTYAGLDEATKGKRIWGEIHEFEINTLIKDIYPVLVRVQDNNIVSEDVPFVFLNQVEEKIPQLQFSLFLIETFARLDVQFSEFESEGGDAEGMSVIIYKDFAAVVRKYLSSQAKETFIERNMRKASYNPFRLNKE